MSAKFIDFQQLKETVKIDEVFPLLGLQLKRYGAQQGGDVIALVAHIKAMAMKEAAQLIAGNSGLKPEPRALARGPPVSSTVPEKEKAGFNPLTYLQAEHPLVQALGVSAETAAHFGAGFAPRGILRGRLAIPIHDRHGMLIAYCGRALKDESPTLTFPNGFQPGEDIFGGHLVRAGQLTLVRDPLQVLTAFESGVENVVAFLTDSIAAQQLEMLASLMDERHCETVELV